MKLLDISSSTERANPKDCQECHDEHYLSNMQG